MSVKLIIPNTIKFLLKIFYFLPIIKLEGLYMTENINPTRPRIYSREEFVTDIVNKQEFLRLLTTELRYQNPLDPLDNKQFLTQLAQFTSLEQLIFMKSNLEALAATNKINNALGLLNTMVRIEQGGESVRGVVKHISLEEKIPILTIQTADGQLKQASLNNLKAVWLNI